jgi:hypothetical protein
VTYGQNKCCDCFAFTLTIDSLLPYMWATRLSRTVFVATKAKSGVKAGDVMIGRVVVLAFAIAAQAAVALAHEQSKHEVRPFPSLSAQVEISQNASITAYVGGQLKPSCELRCLSPQTAAVGVKISLKTTVPDFPANSMVHRQGVSGIPRIPQMRAPVPSAPGLMPDAGDPLVELRCIQSGAHKWAVQRFMVREQSA